MTIDTEPLPPLTVKLTAEIWSEALCALTDCADEAEARGNRAWNNGRTRTAIRCWISAAHYRAASGISTVPQRWRVNV